ncbi:MAG TPA: hypothetical protein VMX13_00895 [Sedimentisphaerales bacterium]|nr:hypothetical protein [Sedimentisphaerales bacterium]
MGKQKRGLHKEITSIFDGVPVPKDPGTSQSPPSSAPERGGQEHRPMYARKQVQMPVFPGPAVEQANVSEVSRPQPAPESSPKAVPIERPQVGIILKSGGGNLLERTYQLVRAKLFASKATEGAGRKKAAVALAPVLLVVLIVVLGKVLPGPKGGHEVVVNPAFSAAAGGSELQIDWQIPEPYPQTLRDPMQFGSVTRPQPGPDGQEGTDGQLVVTGIVYSKDNPTAVIGTQIVHINDEISGVTVAEISEDSVVFEKDGKRWTQKVRKEQQGGS